MSLSRDDFATAFRALNQKAASIQDIERAFRVQADAVGARKTLAQVLVDLAVIPADRTAVLSASVPVDPRRDSASVDVLGEMLLRAEIVNEAELEKLVNSFISLKERKALAPVPIPRSLQDRIDFEWGIGHGVYGTTYRARREALPHECAVKVFRGFATDAERDAFVARVKALVGRTDSGLVVLYEAGEADGVPYTVAELVEGQSVDSLIEEHKISVRRGFEIMEKVAKAFAPLHAKGEAHGALRASAIIIGKDDAARVAEFGWVGKGTPADDVFAMGEVLYEIAAGVPPYAGFHSKELKPPSRFNVHATGSAENVILRALSLDPARRYRDAGEMLVDLQKVLKHEEVPVFVPSKAPREGGSRLPFVIGVAAAVLLIVGAAFMATRSKKQPDAPGPGTEVKKSGPKPGPGPVAHDPPPEKKTDKPVVPPAMVNKVNEWKKKGPVGLNEVRDVRYACTNAIAERNWAKLADICDEAVVRGFHDGKDRDFIHYYGARAALELGDTQKALGEVSRALELNEGSTDYLDLRITIHLKRTENRKALADMGTRYGKAFGDINRQIIDFTKQIQSTPDDPTLYTARGAFLHYKRNYDDAARDFRMAIQGGDSKARYFLALTLAADEQKEPAVEALRAFLAGHPESPGAEEARQFLAELTK